VLAGVAKQYVATIPQEACQQTAAVEVTAKSEPFTLSRRLDVSRTDCE